MPAERRKFVQCLAIATLALATGLPGGRAAQSSLPQGSWTDHGLTRAQRAELRRTFQRGIDEKQIPGGSLLIIHRGEVIFREAFGLADLESGRSFSTEDPCFIASLTKPHTATLLTLLADQGVLSLDTPVDRYLPEFAKLRIQGSEEPAKAPTLRQALSHTAGFPGNDDLKAGEFEVNLDGSLAEAVADLAKRPLIAPPGKSFHYGRLGYMLAARVVEVSTGKPFEEVLREKLFLPMGATSATFYPAAEERRRIPTPYVRSENGLQVRTGEPLGRTINPGGGLYSTLDDVGRLMMLHRNRGRVQGKSIVSSRALAEMYRRQPATRDPGYGLGWNTLRERGEDHDAVIQHIGGSGTFARLDFERDLIVVLLTQVPQAQTIPFRRSLLETIDRILAPAAPAATGK